MKILHLIYSQQIAGAEKYLQDLLPGIQENGIDCSLICVIPKADEHKFLDFASDLNKKGIATQIFTGNKFNFFTLAKRINKYLRANEIQCMHSHLFKADLLAVIIKWFFNKKVFSMSTKHGYDEKYFNRHPVNPGKIVYNVYYFISRIINANINAQFTTSKAMSDLYFNLKLTKARLPFIHHGINLKIGSDTSILKQGSPQLIIVGRIELIKGHIYLFKALPNVIKKFPGLKLLVLGNGREKENLQQLAKVLGVEANISFMGFQQDPYAYISQSDVIILPSLFEAFGLVYIEAFALKAPVIAFDVPAGNEIISNNETGILVPLFDVEALTEKIILLLDNPGERKRICNNAYLRYVTYFNTQRMIGETITWYQSFSLI